MTDPGLATNDTPTADERAATRLGLPARPGTALPDALAQPQLWIQCVEAPAEHPGRLGWTAAVITTAPDHRRQELARAMADDHQALYGGRWEVLTGHTWRDVQNAQGQLRAAANRRGKT